MPEGYEYSVCFETVTDTKHEVCYLDKHGNLSADQLREIVGTEYGDVRVLRFYVRPMSGGYPYGQSRPVNA